MCFNKEEGASFEERNSLTLLGRGFVCCNRGKLIKNGSKSVDADAHANVNANAEVFVTVDADGTGVSHFIFIDDDCLQSRGDGGGIHIAGFFIPLAHLHNRRR